MIVMNKKDKSFIIILKKIQKLNYQSLKTNKEALLIKISKPKI